MNFSQKNTITRQIDIVSRLRERRGILRAKGFKMKFWREKTMNLGWK
jgi:hypothetical protein